MTNLLLISGGIVAISIVAMVIGGSSYTGIAIVALGVYQMLIVIRDKKGKNPPN